MREKIWNAVNNAGKIAICGHVRPDGDCVGSCMALYMYVKKAYPDKEVYVYMDGIPKVFESMCRGYDVITDYRDVSPDLFIALDCSDSERLGDAREYFDRADVTINIDHHISNLSYADINHFMAKSSSTSEVIYELLDENLIDKAIAAALYTGIIHDTGVLQYSNTSKRTLEIVGNLLDHGIPSDKIIDETFYQKTYSQNLLMARCVLESRMYLGNRCIMSVATKDILEEYNATTEDLDGIVNILRITKGVECAVLMHETKIISEGEDISENSGVSEYKVSMRANNDMDVSRVALMYGGGGHIKAAGCTMTGTLEEVTKKLLSSINEVMSSIYQMV